MSSGLERNCMVVVVALPLTACPLKLDVQEHQGRLWAKQIVGARGSYSGDRGFSVPITDDYGEPLWGGGCVCLSYHAVFLAFMSGDIEANEITDGLLEGIDSGAVLWCEHRAEELGMAWNNCAEAVAASPGPPEHRGACSFWAAEDHCDLEFMGGASTETGTEGAETGTGG